MIQEEKEVHLGENLKELRELLGVKQDVIAKELKVSQQTVSNIEKDAIVAPEILETYALILKIPVEAIKNFNKEKVVNIIATTFTNTNHDNSAFIQHNPVFNTADKLVELYEKMLKVKDDEITRLREELEKEKSKQKK